MAVSQLNFVGGIDKRTAAELVDPTSRVLDIVNVVQTHRGAAEKRPGLKQLATTVLGAGSMGSPLKLATRGSELLAIDGANAWSYSPAEAGWSSRGSVPYCKATRAHVYTNAAQTGQSSFSLTEGGGIQILAWRTCVGVAGAYLPGDVYVQILDATTGATIVAPTAMTAGAIYYNPVVIIIGARGYLFYSDNTGKIYGQVLTISTLTWGGATTIVSDANPTSSGIPGFIFDAVPYAPANTGILLAYPQANAGHFSAANARYLRLEALPALTITASSTLTAYSSAWNTVTLISCRVDTTLNVAWVAWEYQQAIGGNNFTVQAQAFNATTWASLGAVFSLAFPLPFNGSTTAGQLSVEPYDATSALFVIAQAGARFDTSGASHAQCTYSPPAYTTSPAHGPPGLGRVVSRPFRATVAGQTRWLVLFALFQEFTFNQAAQAVSYVLIDAIATGSGLFSGGFLIGAPVAVLAPRQGNYPYAYNAGTFDLRPPSITNPCITNASTYRIPIGVNASEEFYAPPNVLNPPPGVCFIDLATFDFTGATAYQCAEGANEAFLSGGFPCMYDGAGFQELGFLQWPSSITFTTSNTGGFLGAGQYGFAFCFAAIDNAGLITRSTFWTTGSQAALNFGSGSTNSVTFTIPCPAYSFHPNSGRQIVLEVYRTTANGSIFFFEGSAPAPVNMGVSATISYTSGPLDTTIQVNPYQYTTGGVLDSVNPPSARCMISHVERLWMIDDTGYVIWYSTPFSPADAPYFNEGLTLQFTDAPLTALGGLDDKLVVFTAADIYYVQGFGPNLLGQGSDLTQATVIPTPEGAADWRSIATVPSGIIFQGPSGRIYLLTRELSVVNIGQDVQDLTSVVGGAQLVLSAQTVAANNHVRFTLANGTVLAFDYVAGAWGRLQYTASIFGASMGHAVMSGPVWSAIGASGVVGQDKLAAWQSTAAGCCFDTNAAGVNSFVTASIACAYLRPGGLQGWSLLGDVMGIGALADPCDVLMTLTFDYGAQSQGPQRFTYAQLSYANPVDAQWSMHPQNTALQAESIAVTLSDAPPTGGTAVTGAGLRWLGLSFEYEPLDLQKRTVAPAVKA